MQKSYPMVTKPIDLIFPLITRTLDGDSQKLSNYAQVEVVG